MSGATTPSLKPGGVGQNFIRLSVDTKTMRRASGFSKAYHTEALNRKSGKDRETEFFSTAVKGLAAMGTQPDLSYRHTRAF